MIRGRYLSSMDDVKTVFELRKLVFVEEQGFSLDSEIDEYDKMSVYALVFDESDRPVGTGRLFVDADGRFSVGRVCVLREERNKGFGDLVMRMLLARALDLNAPSVYLSAQADKKDFYKKYGFTEFGEPYLDEGSLHIGMRALRDEISIEGTCNRTGGRMF